MLQAGRNTSCRALSRAACAALLLLLTVGSEAWAAGKGGKQGALAGLLFATPVLLLLSWSFQVAVAALSPGFVRRAQVAVERHWPITALWGFAGLALLGIVSAILGQGGRPGQGLAGVCLLFGLLFAGLGATGIAASVGAWVFRRRQEEAPHIIVLVLAGAAIWAWATLVPCVGTLLGLAGLLLSLGAAIQVALNWSRLGGQLAPAQPPSPETVAQPSVNEPPAPQS